MDYPVLLSSRLHLREHLLKDKSDYYQLMSNSEAIRYYGRMPIIEVEEAVHEIELMHDKFLHSQLIKWAVILKQSDIYIGSVGIKDYINPHNRGTLSCIIFPKYWNQGYAYEAISEVIEFAFCTLELHRLQVYVDPLNSKAMALFNKLGFCKEAILYEYEFERGQFIDIAILGLIINR